MPSKKPKKKPGPTQPHPGSRRRTPDQIIAATRETLNIARRGLSDLQSGVGDQTIPGLYNVAVFGRAVTQGLNRLRNEVEGYDDWWASHMPGDDPLLLFFNKIRNSILKEVDVERKTTVVLNGTIDFNKILSGPAPAGVTSIFVGEGSTGGSGWEVTLPDGTKEKYYAALHPDFGARVTLHLPDSPESHLGKTLEQTDAVSLARTYVGFLDRLVDDAETRFITKKP